MSGVNKVILIGNLGKDPELKSTSGGKSVANFSLATNETWTKDGEKHEKVEWHRIVAWEKLADLAGKYLVKGRQVYVEGKIQTRSYEKDGETKYVTEIVATNITFLGGKQEDSAPKEKPKEQPKKAAPPPASEPDYGPPPGMDDVPF